jgi:8-oxo-dGTP diphosphatase
METIDKLSWIHLENRKMLFVKTKYNDTLYTPGGKREEGETDEQALIREIKEELSVDLIPDTIRYLVTFTAQAHGKPEGVMVQLKCHTSDFIGTLAPASEVEELAWLDSKDEARTSITGQLTLRWLKEQNIID